MKLLKLLLIYNIYAPPDINEEKFNTTSFCFRLTNNDIINHINKLGKEIDSAQEEFKKKNDPKISRIISELEDEQKQLLAFQHNQLNLEKESNGITDQSQLDELHTKHHQPTHAGIIHNLAKEHDLPKHIILEHPALSEIHDKINEFINNHTEGDLNQKLKEHVDNLSQKITAIALEYYKNNGMFYKMLMDQELFKNFLKQNPWIEKLEITNTLLKRINAYPLYKKDNDGSFAKNEQGNYISEGINFKHEYFDKKALRILFELTACVNLLRIQPFIKEIFQLKEDSTVELSAIDGFGFSYLQNHKPDLFNNQNRFCHNGAIHEISLGTSIIRMNKYVTSLNKLESNSPEFKKLQKEANNFYEKERKKLNNESDFQLQIKPQLNDESTTDQQKKRLNLIKNYKTFNEYFLHKLQELKTPPTLNDSASEELKHGIESFKDKFNDIAEEKWLEFQNAKMKLDNTMMQERVLAEELLKEAQKFSKSTITIEINKLFDLYVDYGKYLKNNSMGFQNYNFNQLYIFEPQHVKSSLFPINNYSQVRPSEYLPNRYEALILQAFQHYKVNDKNYKDEIKTLNSMVKNGEIVSLIDSELQKYFIADNIATTDLENEKIISNRTYFNQAKNNLINKNIITKENFEKLLDIISQNVSTFKLHLKDPSAERIIYINKEQI